MFRTGPSVGNRAALAAVVLMTWVCAVGGAARASASDVAAPAYAFSLPALTVEAPPALAPEAPPAFGTAADRPFADAAWTGGLLARRSPSGAAGTTRTRPPVVLSAERARVLLRSLTVPGWGQYTTGHHTAAAVFGIAELGVWTSFTAFRIQEQMRRDTYVRTARVLAGIDLHGRDEEFKRIVGAYISSDEYNQLVVARDAANLYYDDPAAFNAYLAAHSLTGKDSWSWADEASLARYQGQRKQAQRAALRANAALAVAVANRLLSAIHAARLRPAAHAQSWELEATPADDNPTAFRLGIRTRF